MATIVYSGDTNKLNRDGDRCHSWRFHLLITPHSRGYSQSTPRWCIGEIPRAGDGQEVTTDDMEIVSVLRAKLADKVGKERFELWFGQSTSLELAGDTLVVSAPSQFFRDFLRSSFRAQIETACFETFGRKLKLTFRIDERLPIPSQSQPPQSDEASAQTNDSKPTGIKLFEQTVAAPESSGRKSASRVGQGVAAEVCDTRWIHRRASQPDGRCGCQEGR